MHNAAANFDDDFGYEPKPRKNPPRKPRTGTPAGKKTTAKRRRFDMHRVARFAAVGMAATMALGIMVNALVLQKGHHPAPLFGHAVAPPAARAKVETPAPPAARAVQADEASAATVAKPRKTVLAARETTSEGTSDDAIGRLLAGGAKGAPKGETKSEAKSEVKTVGGVQRALNKLGFKVPATGAIGPATKKAIEAFEKDRHLPVKGEVSRRLVRVLAAESGIRID